jgi:hypothetical protein
MQMRSEKKKKKKKKKERKKFISMLELFRDALIDNTRIIVIKSTCAVLRYYSARKA